VVRKQKPIAAVPLFGLLHGFLLVAMFGAALNWNPQRSAGLVVNMPPAGTSIDAKSPWSETVGVYVCAHGGFYVNGEGVAHDELRNKLLSALRTRNADWSAYLEADQNATAGEFEYAMSVIQEVGARLIWVTPEMREELNRRTRAK
jgi:biopolymer transport protein ExbD